MTTAPRSDQPDPRDGNARQLYAAALAHTSPRTLARLREARRGAAAAVDARRRRPLLGPWLAGGAMAATLALAVLLHPGQPGPTPGPDARTTASAPADGPAAEAAFAAAADTDFAGPLQEDPGFYVWLDSVDANALAME